MPLLAPVHGYKDDTPGYAVARDVFARGLHHVGLIDQKTGLFTVWQPTMVAAPAVTPPATTVADAVSRTGIRISGRRRVRGSSKRVKVAATVRTTSGARATGTVELVVDGKVVARRALGAQTEGPSGALTFSPPALKRAARAERRLLDTGRGTQAAHGPASPAPRPARTR
jgi:hypothetical protein